MTPEERRQYLDHVADELGGGYIEQFDDQFYHITVEPMRERDDGTLVPDCEEDSDARE